MKIKSIPFLIGFVAASQMAGVIGSVFTVSAIPTWYATLARPGIAPPNWVFGPVWITLYALMGIAAYLVWEHGKKKSKVPLNWFFAQLALNAIWSIIFFGMKSLGLALAELALLWAAIVVTIIKFHEVDKRAAYLMVPYLLWTTFAMALNFMFWSLNR